MKCPKCGKETNTVFIDGLSFEESNGCYLTPILKDGVWIWGRGCISKDNLNPYYVWSAKQSLGKSIIVNGKPWKSEGGSNCED